MSSSLAASADARPSLPCLPLSPQYYFETIFPRIPVKIVDEIEDRLKSMGLPTRAVGNGGQGGEDRRGVMESAARPASVKQSLSVALGQRAPNRAQARELGRGTGADLQLERTIKRQREEERRRSRSPHDRDDDRRRDVRSVVLRTVYFRSDVRVWG